MIFISLVIYLCCRKKDEKDDESSTVPTSAVINTLGGEKTDVDAPLLKKDSKYLPPTGIEENKPANVNSVKAGGVNVVPQTRASRNFSAKHDSDSSQERKGINN